MTELPLLERELELQAVARLFAAPAGRLLVVEGEPGIGKTALLTVLRERGARADFRTLAATGQELESELTFAALRRLLAPAIDPSGAVFRGAAALARPVFEPEQEAAGGTDSVLHGVHWLVSDLLEERPVLLVLDDAHWADRGTLRALDLLARGLADRPLRIVVAARRAGARADYSTLAARAHEPFGELVDIRPLSLDGVAHLCRMRGLDADPAFAQSCHHATDGVPFLASALIDEVVRRGVVPTQEELAALEPASVFHWIAARLGAPSTPQRRLAAAVAVLGTNASLARVAQVAGLDLDQAAQAYDVLVRADVLAAESPLRFQHQLVRSLVFEMVAPLDRSRMHDAAADLLTAERSDLEQVAIHLLETQPAAREDRVARLEAAGGAAMRRGAQEAAVAYLRRALVEPPPPGRLGTILRNLGAVESAQHLPDALGHLEDALSCAPSVRERALAALELHRACVYLGRADEGTRKLRLIVEELTAVDMALHDRVAAHVAIGAHQGAVARAIAQPTIQMLRRRVDAGDVVSGLGLAVVSLEEAFTDGTAAAVASHARAGWRNGALLAEETSDSPFACFAGSALTIAGAFREAEQALSQAVDDAVRRGAARAFVIASSRRARARMLAGDLRGARLDGTSAWTAAQALEGWGVHLPYLASVLVELDVETGARDSANIGDDDELVGPDRSLSSVQRFLNARAHAELSSQRFDTALRGALATGSWADERGTRNPVIRWRSVAADALRALGRHEQARAVAADDLREAQRFGAAREISMGLRSVARSATRDEQVDLYTQAVAVVEGTEARLEHADALAGVGGALRRAGHPRDASGHLEAALRHADRCGARPLVDAISRELVACGSRPRPPAHTGADELTPAQLRVAELAASGSTNQQIAQQLFLSLKTVEMHLNHGYRRLGISRRADLPDALTAAVA